MDTTTTRRPVGRRGLGTGLTVFLVVDVLLVLAVAVAFAMFLAGGPAGPGGPAGTAADVGGAASSQEPGEPEEPGEAVSPSAGGGEPITGAFALPSGNIACEITAEAATCTVADSAAEPVAVEGCAGTAGQVLTVTAEGASTPCVQGALPGPAAPGTPLLQYGQTTTSGDFTCDSATSGVTCRHDPTGAGFTLARAGHQVLEPAG